jgi:hypothetical protein
MMLRDNGRYRVPSCFLVGSRIPVWLTAWGFVPFSLLDILYMAGPLDGSLTSDVLHIKSKAIPVTGREGRGSHIF